MTYVLVTVSGGIVDKVLFFKDQVKAIQSLETFVKNMEPEYQDAGVYGPSGLIRNAKHYLDE